MFLHLYFHKIKNDTAKLAFQMSKTDFDKIMYTFNSTGIFMKEKWMKIPTGLVLTRNNIFFKLVEDILQHTIATGIPQQMKQYHDDFMLRAELEVKDDGPKVLTLKDLSFGFNIVLFALGISTIVFILEVIYFHFQGIFRRNLRIFVGKTLVFLLVKQWLQRYHV
jgi:hypothetical protein